MVHSSPKIRDAKAQADRFRAMAKELECDPDEAAFKAKLAVIAKAKPKPGNDPAHAGQPRNKQETK